MNSVLTEGAFPEPTWLRCPLCDHVFHQSRLWQDATSYRTHAHRRVGFLAERMFHLVVEAIRYNDVAIWNTVTKHLYNC
jgi:uncharacterized C2H2 Zn-finger protein